MCQFDRRTFSQAVRNTLKLDGWDDLLKSMRYVKFAQYAFLYCVAFLGHKTRHESLSIRL